MSSQNQRSILRGGAMEQRQRKKTGNQDVMGSNPGAGYYMEFHKKIYKWPNFLC